MSLHVGILSIRSNGKQNTAHRAVLTLPKPEGADPTGLLPEPSLFLFQAYLDIQRAVGNKMRVRILPLLAEDRVHNAEELAEALNIPLNTQQYHLDCRPSSARARSPLN